MNTFRINSNPASALAYRNLSKTQSGLQTTLERLSSGMRINKTADDSAGSAISTRISNQVRGMKQANRNAQDTNNLLATAESGLSDISDILSKMRGLSVQASTDTLNDVDRASIDLEFQSLKDELTRIANVTEYNGMNVLNGTYQTGNSPVAATSQFTLSNTQITRVSVRTSSLQSDGKSFNPSISGDGQYVVFRSAASNLVDNDTNGQPDIFVHDRQTGLTERVNVDSSDGQTTGGNSDWPDISGDGRYVAFRSEASNLVDNDTNGQPDIFVHDRQTDFIERVSTDSFGSQANGINAVPTISSDGRYVTFVSDADNLVNNDSNERRDAFIHDRQTGTTKRVSVRTGDLQSDGDSFSPSISGDGRYVAFKSKASNLVDNDTNGKPDIFVHDRQTGLTERVNVDSSDGQTTGGNSDWPDISGDGRYVAFRSEANNLVDNDTNGQPDIFVHDRETGTTEVVSVHSNGTQGNYDSQSPSISDDGRYVAFKSEANNLVDGDTNGEWDIFTTSNPLYEARGHWRVQIGADNDINSQHEFSLTNATANGLDLEDDNVLSVDDARTAITVIDHAIDEVNQERSYIGSEQNKLQFTMSNLSSNIQNIEASRSSIEDADFAAEAADLAKNQILAQSATAMLAQASAISQNVLGLLS